MRKALLLSCFLGLLSISLTAQTESWKRYKDTGGNFSVLFPGEPQNSVNKSDNDIQSHTLLVQSNPVVYTVVYTSMVSEQKVDDPTYEAFKNAVFKELPNCGVGTEGPASPALSGYIGHWYRLNCDMPNAKVTILGDLYWGKHYAYAVMVMYPASVAEPAATKKFLDSFAVVDETK